MAFNSDHALKILDRWVTWNGSEPSPGEAGSVLVAQWILTALETDMDQINNASRHEGVLIQMRWGLTATSVKLHGKKCVQTTEGMCDEDEDTLFDVRMAIFDACRQKKIDLSQEEPSPRTPWTDTPTEVTKAPQSEETAVGKTDELPSTFAVAKGAYGRAAAGKATVEIEAKILQLVKAKLRAVAGWENMPDHPAYDRLILTALSLAAREIAVRTPESLPSGTREWAVWATDAAIEFQAHKNVDQLGDTLTEITTETVGLIISLGSAAGFRGLMDFGGPAEVKEKEAVPAGKRARS